MADEEVSRASRVVVQVPEGRTRTNRLPTQFPRNSPNPAASEELKSLHEKKEGEERKGGGREKKKEEKEELERCFSG